MIPLDECVLFLGAGISLPLPAGGPLFLEVRDACAKRAGVDPRHWTSDASGRDRRFDLLDHVVPEVFLKVLDDAGFDLREALARAVNGDGTRGPNAVHELAASVAAAGGAVWTVNWDTRIEEVDPGLVPAVYPIDGAPSDDTRYGKLHGSAERPETLIYSAAQIVRPIEQGWADALVDSCRGRVLCVAGYAGADVDVYPALSEALAVSRVVYWFEGSKGAGPD